MADNTTLNTGSGGDVIATDDIGGVKHQRVKIEIGADGAASDVHSGNPLPVSDAGGSLTVDGTVGISGAVPVTDNSSTLSIDDGGGSITVDGTVAVSGTVTVGSHAVTNAGTFAVQATVAAGATTIGKAQDAASFNADVGVPALAIRRGTPLNGADTDGDYDVLQMNAGRLWVDASGTILTVGNAGTFAVQADSVIPGTGATNLGKAEDAAHSSGQVGVMALSVRRDANTSLVDTDGDYAPLQVDATGNLKVAIISGAGSGGTSITDDAAFTPGTTSITPVGGTYRSSRDVVDDNDAGAFAITQRRALLTAIETPAGDSAMDDTADAVKVTLATNLDSTNDSITVVPGTGATGLGKVEDAAHSSGDVGVMALAVRRDGNTTLADTTGDYAPLQVDSSGNLKVAIISGGGSGGTAIVDDAAFTVGTTSITPVGGTYRASRDSVNDGDAGAFAMTQTRALIASLETPAGNSAMNEDFSAVQVVMPDGGSGLVNFTALNDTNSLGFLHGRTAIMFRLQGTWVGTVVGEISCDEGNTWTDVVLLNLETAALTAGANSNGQYAFVASGGANYARIRCSAYTSGTIDTFINAAFGHPAITSTQLVGNVIVSSVASVVPGTGATNLGKAIGNAAGSTDTGITPLAIRDDSLSTLSDPEGDYVPLRVNSTGALHVTGGGGGTEYTVNAVVPADPTGATFVMERDDALSALSEVEGDWTNPRSNANGALWVTVDGTVTVAAHNVTNAGTFAVQVSSAIPAGTNNIGDVDIASIAAGDNNIGNVDIVTLPAIPTGSNVIGQVGLEPRTSGGLSLFRSLDIDETEEDVKTSAGQLYGWYIFNAHASAVRYVKFYNATAANVTVGTTTPVLTIPLGPGAAANVEFTQGIAFSTAISVAATTGVADNDTGAPGANEVVINVFYK